MRIEVDFNVCADHGQCAVTAPDIFRIGDDGYLAFEASPDESLRGTAQDAASGCPEQAITIID
jgi:ferredoxin